MTTATLNKSTSRKNVGAAENNRNEVRELVANAKRYADGICVITDRADNKIYVDCKKGLTAQLVLVIDEAGNKKVDYRWYESGETSSKANGYVYTPIVVYDGHGKLTTCLYGTHSLVAMLAHTKEYDALDMEDKTPIVNHKNNKKWDNRKENLEWTTHGGNTRHGKIVASLYRHFGEAYAHIEHNGSTTDFVVLNQALSVKDIEKYCEEIDSKNEFKCANDEYINEEVLECFVNWLLENGYWKQEVIKNDVLCV